MRLASLDWSQLLVLLGVAAAGVIPIVGVMISGLRRLQVFRIVDDILNTLQDVDSIAPNAITEHIAAVIQQVETAMKANGWGTASVGLKHQIELRVRAHVAKVKRLGPASQAIAALKLLVLALAVFGATSARAGGFDWSTGPTIPIMVYTFGSPSPVQVAPGAGLQLSVTHDALKVDVLGRAWDLLDVTGMLFGALVNPGGPGQFGTLSAALGPCFFSSLVCVGFGKELLGPQSQLASGGWFWTLALSFNWALTPTTSESGPPWHMPRANTLYAFGGP